MHHYAVVISRGSEMLFKNGTVAPPASLSNVSDACAEPTFQGYLKLAFKVFCIVFLCYIYTPTWLLRSFKIQYHTRIFETLEWVTLV